MSTSQQILDSIILETRILPDLRFFYEQHLRLQVNYFKDQQGSLRADESEGYVNYRVSPGVLLCFEHGKAACLAKLVLQVSPEIADHIANLQGTTSRTLPHGRRFVRAHDPEGREIILEF
jgi:hypothetical protein